MQNKPQNYRHLVVWQKGIELAKLIYRLTAKFPTGEKIRVSCTDAPCGRFDSVEHSRRAGATYNRGVHQFISHAEGSVAELNTQLILAVELKFCASAAAAAASQLMEDLRRMLNGLRRKLERS